MRASRPNKPLGDDAMTSTVPKKRRPWSTALKRAALIQGSMVLFILAMFTTPIFHGADNPLPFYVAGALQFPASIMFIPLFMATKEVGASEIQALVTSAILVVVLQFLFFAVLQRKPWRAAE